MSFLPSWDSADTTAAIAHNLHIIAIIVLGMLFVSEGLALMYDSRKEHLVGVAALDAESQRKRDIDTAEARRIADVESLQKRLSEADKKVAELDRIRQPRHLMDNEKAKLGIALKNQPAGTLVIKAGAMTDDARNYAEEISDFLQRLGWNCRIDNAIFSGSM